MGEFGDPRQALESSKELLFTREPPTQHSNTGPKIWLRYESHLLGQHRSSSEFHFCYSEYFVGNGRLESRPTGFFEGHESRPELIFVVRPYSYGEAVEVVLVVHQDFIQAIGPVGVKPTEPISIAPLAS